MAASTVEHLSAELSRLAPAWRVREEARECGASRRQGRVDSYALLMTVVLGVCTREGVSLAGLRRVYADLTGVVVARSSFFQRFTVGFMKLVRWLLDVLMDEASQSVPRPPGPLAFFKDVLCEDATIVKLHDQLAPAWPGPRTNSAPAAAKVHARIRVTTGELLKAKVTHGRVADCKAFGVGHELRNTLLIFDQGYSSPSLWRRVANVGGYFLTRLPADRDPTIVCGVWRRRRRTRDLSGRSLRCALSGLKYGVVDAACSFRCRVRAYRRPHGRIVTEDFRVVAIYNDEKSAWHLYVTNVPQRVLSAQLVARAYRLRWRVEQFFKTTKSGSGLTELPSRNEHTVLTLIYATLCRATLSMRGRRRGLARLCVRTRRRINAETWHKHWNLLARDLLRCLFPTPPEVSPRDLLRLLGDPNTGRWNTLDSFLEEA